MNTNTATQIGRNAYLAGQPCIPFMNTEIVEAISGLKVGGDAAKIMRAFTSGWTTANIDAEWLNV
jgi:hypothetical protein